MSTHAGPGRAALQEVQVVPYQSAALAMHWCPSHLPYGQSNEAKNEKYGNQDMCEEREDDPEQDKEWQPAQQAAQFCSHQAMQQGLSDMVDSGLILCCLLGAIASVLGAFASSSGASEPYHIGDVMSASVKLIRPMMRWVSQLQARLCKEW